MNTYYSRLIEIVDNKVLVSTTLLSGIQVFHKIIVSKKNSFLTKRGYYQIAPVSWNVDLIFHRQVLGMHVLIDRGAFLEGWIAFEKFNKNRQINFLLETLKNQSDNLIGSNPNSIILFLYIPESAPNRKQLCYKYAYRYYLNLRFVRSTIIL